MSAGFRSSHTICTMRSPQVVAMRVWPASIAGIAVEPGSARPSASTMDVIVLAVPIVLQVPGLRVMCASSWIHSASLTLPACFSSQNRRVCVPAPTLRSGWPAFR